jgi:tetratricopeptide (TPR) repeat protein
MLGIRVAPEVRRNLSAGQAENPEAYRLYEQGLGYLRRFGPENVRRAIQLLQDAVAQDPGFALGYTHLAEAYLANYSTTKNAADVDLATRNVNRALDIDPDMERAHATLASIKAVTGQYGEAIREFRRALDADAGDSIALVGLANAYSDSSQFSKAEETFQQAIRTRPDYWLGYSSLGAFYFAQSRYPEAEKMFKALVELIPENVLGYLDLGAVYLQTARYADAEKVLQEAVTIQPNAKAYSNLSICYSFQNQPRRAVEMLEKAVEIDPNNDINWRNLGDAYMQVPDLAQKAPAAYRKALTAVKQRLDIKPDSKDLLLSSALYSAKLNDLARSLAELGKAYTLGPMSASQLFKASLVWELAGKRDRALGSLSEAVRRGYSREQISKEPELAELRKDPRFSKIEQISDALGH